ncbi:MgtC family [Methanosarcina horonobensis HB-1 = JCM 15518]|uniref:MgtC family n=2 Tax=Methanosarcina horonobensis TaxID=418008 RepID=A0A0E3SG55_9EURY|nr:MgtC family [Methanosarcina horonobensis HB-1 = JCM 15518]
MVGVEREHRGLEHEIFAGVRTYSITCITGMLVALTSESAGPGFVYVAALFFAAICSIITYSKIFLFKRIGVTSPITLFFIFVVGVLVGYDYGLYAIVSSIVVEFLLIQKQLLHQFAGNLTKEELYNAIQFLAVAFILYPVMPDKQFFGLINLRSAILIVVIVSLISFLSYVLLRKFGTERGLCYSGFLGGFVNSEATTGALAGLSKRAENIAEPILMGILLCNISMLIRNLMLALIVDPTGQTTLLMLPPQLVIILVSAIMILKRNKKVCPAGGGELKIESPFSLGQAFKFGIAFTLILIMGNFAYNTVGTVGIYVTALGALVSSSGVIVSVTLLAVNDGTISYATAANTAVLASLVSTVNKILLSKISGSASLFSLALNTFGIIASIGIAVLLLWNIL